MPRHPSAATVDTPKVPVQQKPASSVPLRIFAASLTSIVVAVHYTNFGPLIPTLITSLHIERSTNREPQHRESLRFRSLRLSLCCSWSI